MKYETIREQERRKREIGKKPHRTKRKTGEDRRREREGEAKEIDNEKAGKVPTQNMKETSKREDKRVR